MSRYDNRPQWLRDWRKLYRAGVVISPYPSPEWIREWAGGEMPPSSEQPRVVEADVVFHQEVTNGK